MSRARSFCRYCGMLTVNLDSCCAAHRDLIKLEQPPPDPLETVPPMRAELRGHGPHRCQACDGAGILYPGVDCDNCDGLGFYSAPRREAVQPTKGMED